MPVDELAIKKKYLSAEKDQNDNGDRIGALDTERPLVTKLDDTGSPSHAKKKSVKELWLINGNESDY